MSGETFLDKWAKDIGDYCNPKGVTLAVEGTKVFIDAFFPGFSDRSIIPLYITNIFETRESFLTIIPVSDRTALDTIDFDLLFCLYLQGDMQVGCCTVEGTLVFQKINARVIAFNEVNLKSHEVLENLIIPSDFIKYTIDFYSCNCEKISV